MAKANSISLCLYILRTQGIAGTRTCSAQKALRRQPQASARPLPCSKTFARPPLLQDPCSNTPRIREAERGLPGVPQACTAGCRWSSSAAC